MLLILHQARNGADNPASRIRFLSTNGTGAFAVPRFSRLDAQARSVSVNATTVQLQRNGSTNRARCMVQYVRPAAAGSNPHITSRTDGC